MIEAAATPLFPAALKEKPAFKRDPVGLSMAGHCRMEIWLAAHGFPSEEPLAGTQRTFDKGHVDETLMFDGILIHDTESGTTEKLGPWWKELGVIVDYQTGEQLDTSTLEVGNRQAEVEQDGVVGHMDAIIGPEPMLVIDHKSQPGLTWKRNITGDLMANPFSRENVIQVATYRDAARRKWPGLNIDGGGLLLYNRENSRVAFRRVPEDPAIVEEGKERLSWVNSPAEPTPDWEWEKGRQIPLRCGYCSFREACAETRGMALDRQTVNKAPVWIAK